MIRDDVFAVAEKLYDSKTPYHNFRHVMQTLESARKILERCKKEGVKVEEDVVEYALLFHDAGYHENHKEKGFRTKEAYACSIAEKTLRLFGFEDTFIGKVKIAIAGTEKEGDFLTNEAKVVRAADLAGLMGDYQEFKSNFKRLEDEWRKETLEALEFYLKQDIRLTPGHDTNGESEFHANLERNLRRLKTDLGII